MTSCAQHPGPDAPAALEIYHGGFGGPSYGAWWDGGQIIYESFEESYGARQQTRLSPSAAQWRRFWRIVEQLGVWEWALRYEPSRRFEPGTALQDGVHWSITLEYAGRRVESSGDSVGPDADDLDDSPGFAGLLEALSRLLGGRAFA